MWLLGKLIGLLPLLIVLPQPVLPQELLFGSFIVLVSKVILQGEIDTLVTTLHTTLMTKGNWYPIRVKPPLSLNWGQGNFLHRRINSLQ